ncbi:MAG: hypothetical protein PHV17_09315 [Candidatus Omnitrophica bacterium]|nr:hypothetical protein [Candidatus Omnitrophota bacterium]
MNKKKSAALILALIVLVTMVILCVSMFSRSISESRLVMRNAQAKQAFWLAEAGANQVVYQLRSNFSVSPSTAYWVNSTLAQGDYSVQVSPITAQTRTLTAHGYVPSKSNFEEERVIVVSVKKYIPANFYDYAIYSSGNIDINGDAYSVEGKVIYATTYDVEHPGGVTGTVTNDPLINPLSRLDFEAVYAISDAQGNVYDADRIQDVRRGRDSFPTDFWYTRADDSLDNDADGITDESDEWVPNVVYVETDLQVTGSFGTIGGFYVVVGDVLTDPEDTADATVNGVGTIEGAVYTRGNFRVNGGGGRLNVNGGVWAGNEARLNGSADVAYNQDYMDAISGLSIGASAQITNWRDNQSLFPITP